MTEKAKSDAAGLARALLRASRAGTLATSDGGQPFASLVTPATAVDGSVLMLLSGLSPHTRHLRTEPRCSLLVTGPATGRNPQTAPRLTLVGAAAPEPEPALKARWIRLHPYAAFYAGLGDFQLWRMRALAGQYVGGFASAHRLRGTDLVADPAVAACLERDEGEIMAQCNIHLSNVLDVVAQGVGGGEGWRMVGCDPDGCDLGREEQTLRFAWTTTARNGAEVRERLLCLADAARKGIATAPRPVV